MPEQVSVAMNEIAADMREGLLALAVGAGLQVMAQLMEADVSAVCGPRGKHDPERAATRHGTERGSVSRSSTRLNSRSSCSSAVPSPGLARASSVPVRRPGRQRIRHRQANLVRCVSRARAL